jgi:hypothetical protein
MYSERKIIEKYKDETGDLLIEHTDQFQAFVEKTFDARLRTIDDVRFEGNPTILADALQMHKIIKPDDETRLFNFLSTGIETTSISGKNTHSLKTIIPDRSYETYILGNNIEIDGGWVGLNISNIINFCKLGANEDTFRYRYDSELGDFHIKFGGLRRKFCGMDAEFFPKMNMPAMEFRGKGIINLKKLKKVITPANKLGMINLTLHLECDQLQLYSHESSGEDIIDDLDELIPVEDWNGEDVISNYSVPLLSGIVDILSKHFNEARISFSDDAPMKIYCGKILGDEEKDDRFCAEMMLANRTQEE